MNGEKDIIFIALAGFALLLLSRRSAAAQGGYAVPQGPGQYAQPVRMMPNGSSIAAAAQSDAYRGVGSLIGSIYRNVFGNIGSAAGQAGAPDVPVLPTDGIAANPPNGDPYQYDAAAWSNLAGGAANA